MINPRQRTGGSFDNAGAENPEKRDKPGENPETERRAVKMRRRKENAVL